MNLISRSKTKCNSMANRQRGAIAIIVGLTILVLIGAAGLAVDSGRLYVSKTETQNAADACALAASQDMTGAPTIPLANFPIAENAGRLVARRNNVGFNNTSIPDSPAAITVQFSTSLNGPWVSAGAATTDARYVRCTIAEAGITPALMRYVGFGNQTVNSLATATLAPSFSPCAAIPVSLCATSPTPPYGLTPGQWLTALFGSQGQLTGSFGWIDFSPPNGGANELRDLLNGTGACTIASGAQVGQSGGVQTLRIAWNTRFGIYAPSAPNSVPDRSGYAYTLTNWPAGNNAIGNFVSARRPANAPYGSSVVDGNTITGLDVATNSTVRQAPALAATGADRRVVPVPIVQCSGFESSQRVTVLNWGCILMLHPMSQQGGPPEVTIEYIGLVSQAGSPCASVGGVGNSTSTGPLVPALVQ